MSTIAADPWSAEASGPAMRILWDAAARRPHNGITAADARELLPSYGEHVGEVLRLAEGRGHLLRVARMTWGESGRVRYEWRWHAMGGRP